MDKTKELLNKDGAPTLMSKQVYKDTNKEKSKTTSVLLEDASTDKMIRPVPESNYNLGSK